MSSGNQISEWTIPNFWTITQLGIWACSKIKDVPPSEKCLQKHQQMFNQNEYLQKLAFQGLLTPWIYRLHLNCLLSSDSENHLPHPSPEQNQGRQEVLCGQVAPGWLVIAGRANLRHIAKKEQAGYDIHNYTAGLELRMSAQFSKILWFELRMPAKCGLNLYTYPHS